MFWQGPRYPEAAGEQVGLGRGSARPHVHGAATAVGAAGGTGRAGQPEDGGLTIRPPLSQHELAASVGSTREAVARALRLLREQGLVRTGSGPLSVADPEPLRLPAGREEHMHGG